VKGAVILKYNLLVALRRFLNWRYPGNKKPPSKWIAVLLGSSWLRGQDLNLAACTNKIASSCLKRLWRYRITTTSSSGQM